MKRSIGGLRDYLRRADLVQRLVLGWSASPALGLRAISAYEEVAVEGERAGRALARKMGEAGALLSGIEEGGDRDESLKSSLTLISQLLEADAQARERWMYLSLTLGMALSVGVAVALSLGGIRIEPFHLIPLALVYPLIPGLSLERLSDDPAAADYIASTLERGGGRIYALRHLGLYEPLVLDVDLDDVELPPWANVLREMSDRKTLAKVMRRTSTMLREFKRITSAWRARMRSMKAMSLIISSAIGLSNVVLMRVVTSPLLYPMQIPADLPLTLLLAGLISTLISAKPLGASIESGVAYLSAFSLAYALIPP